MAQVTITITLDLPRSSESIVDEILAHTQDLVCNDGMMCCYEQLFSEDEATEIHETVSVRDEDGREGDLSR